MKLNKVMALALSGLMAVSMLAGCAGDPSNGDGGNTEVTPPASDAVSIMNEAQSAVKFEANADFDAALAAAAKKVSHSDIKSQGYAVTQVKKGNVWDELEKKLDVDAGLVGTTGDIFFNDAADGAQKGGESATLTGLWKVEADGLTEKAALEQVAAQMKGQINGDEKYPETVTLTGKGTYEATYTGNVSIVTVNTADGGETATAYYIAVAVTQTLARDPQTNV